jgi:DNA-binding MarR family transcriptional regulator
VTRSPPSPDEAEYANAARLREALTAFSHVSETITRQNGLTIPRYQLLLMIRTARNGNGRATQQELRERLALAQSSLAELIQRAEAAGLVRRELSPTNRRHVLVALTDEGAKRLADTVSTLAAARRTLRTALADIVASLDTPTHTSARRP